MGKWESFFLKKLFLGKGTKNSLKMEGYKTEESIVWEHGGDLAELLQTKAQDPWAESCVTAPSRTSLNVEYRLCLIFFLIRSDFQ